MKLCNLGMAPGPIINSSCLVFFSKPIAAAHHVPALLTGGFLGVLSQEPKQVQAPLTCSGERLGLFG